MHLSMKIGATAHAGRGTGCWVLTQPSEDGAATLLGVEQSLRSPYDLLLTVSLHPLSS